MLFRLIFILFLLVLPNVTLCQKKYNLTIVGNGIEQISKKQQNEFKDSLELLKYLRDVRSSAIQKGYLLASIDSIKFNSENKQVIAWMFADDKYDNITVTGDRNELNYIRDKTGIKEKVLSGVPLNPFEFDRFMKKVLSAYLDNGYPFAKVNLENINLNTNSLSAELIIYRGPYVIWESIHTKGDSTVNSQHISSIVGIYEGDVINESQLQVINDRLKQTPYLDVIKPYEVLFTSEGAQLFLYLKNKPVSAVNGFIGFQPDAQANKTTVTGELNLKLLNALNHGELFNVQWRSIREQTQSLKMQLNYPYLFNSPFGIDVKFNLYKRDTSFIETDFQTGIQYTLKYGNVIKALYRNISSNVLEGGTNNPLYSNLGNAQSNNYGLNFTSRKIDYLPNPTKGRIFEMEFLAGSRKTFLTDTSQVLKSLTYRTKIMIDWYYPLTKRNVLRFKSQLESFSAEKIYQNEVYRFGGLNEQRGFNEDEILATTKICSGIEYRFLIDKNTFVFAFYDQSWYENISSEYYNDYPLGFGTGFSFSTNFGVFAMSYALGKQFDNPILLRDGKIHFGYIALF